MFSKVSARRVEFNWWREITRGDMSTRSVTPPASLHTRRGVSSHVRSRTLRRLMEGSVSKKTVNAKSALEEARARPAERLTDGTLAI